MTPETEATGSRKRPFANRSGSPPVNRLVQQRDSETALQSSQPMDDSAPETTDNSINGDRGIGTTRKQLKRNINQVNNPIVIHWSSDEENNNVAEFNILNTSRNPIKSDPHRESRSPQQPEPPLTHEKPHQHTAQIEPSSASEYPNSIPPPSSSSPILPRRENYIQRDRTRKRKHYSRWTTDEVAALREGLSVVKGRDWQKILNKYRHRFADGRTGMDLRDKARNEIKQRKLRGEDLEEFAFADPEGSFIS